MEEVPLFATKSGKGREGAASPQSAEQLLPLICADER
jgi:hypothetical protein